MATTNWIGGSGNWGDASNWSAGVPDGTSGATLGDTGAYSASIDTGDSFSIGTLNITGPHAVFDFYGTLNVNSAINVSGGDFVLAGTIVGGEIRQTGGSITFAGTPFRANNPYPGADGTLDGEKFVGTMNLANDTAVVNIKDGLTVTGSDGKSPGVVNITGSDAQINFYGSQTFDNATVNIGGNGLYSYLLAYDQNGAATTLTLGRNLDVVATTGNVYFGGDNDATIVNQGTITAGVSGKFFEVFSRFTNEGTIDIRNGELFAINTPAFTNTGKITVTGNGVFMLLGPNADTQVTLKTGDLGAIRVSHGGSLDISAVLDNTGAVLRVGASTPLQRVTFRGTIEGGTIFDIGNGFIFNAATLDHVKYRGDFAALGSVEIDNGLKLTGANGTGNGAMTIGDLLVAFRGTQTFNNATITLGTSVGGGVLEAVNAAGATAQSTLTLGAGITLFTAVATSSEIGGNGRIVNRGEIIAATTGGTLDINSSIFVNDGRLTVDRGQRVIAGALFPAATFNNNGAIEVTDGSLQIAGVAGGTGNYQIDSAGTLAFNGRTAVGLAISFYGSGGTLQVATTFGFKAGYIGGFASGDTIDLKNFAYSGTTKMSFFDNRLTVSSGKRTATLNLAGCYDSASFVAASDGANGTAITYDAAAPTVASAHTRLHQFTSAIAVHSADRASSISVHPHTPSETPMSLLAGAHH